MHTQSPPSNPPKQQQQKQQQLLMEESMHKKQNPRRKKSVDVCTLFTLGGFVCRRVVSCDDVIFIMKIKTKIMKKRIRLNVIVQNE